MSEGAQKRCKEVRGGVHPPAPTTAAAAATLCGAEGEVRGGGGPGAGRGGHPNPGCPRRARLGCPCAAPCGATRGDTATAPRRPRSRWGAARLRHRAVRARRAAPRLAPRWGRGPVSAPRAPPGPHVAAHLAARSFLYAPLRCAVLIQEGTGRVPND